MESKWFASICYFVFCCTKAIMKTKTQKEKNSRERKERIYFSGKQSNGPFVMALASHTPWHFGNWKGIRSTCFVDDSFIIFCFIFDNTIKTDILHIFFYEFSLSFFFLFLRSEGLFYLIVNPYHYHYLTQ